MSRLLFIVSMLFLAVGLGYGKGAGSLTGSTNVINAIVKTLNGLGGLLFLMLLIAQFIEFFKGRATVRNGTRPRGPRRLRLMRPAVDIEGRETVSAVAESDRKGKGQ